MMKNKIENYFDRLWPINRSLTGNGNRDTLEILSEIIDLSILEIPSGTKCFDWIVPPEWNVREAWIKNSKGQIVINFSDNNLHLLGYSTPIHKKLTFDELKSNLYTLPNQPELIPYLTSYYKEKWGFCLSQNQFDELDITEEYEVFIDSTLDKNGSMTIGEAVINGESDKEVLISTYICHPSMANNELSGPLVASFLYQELKKLKKLKYTYRFLFIPETIGSIYYLSQKGEYLKEKLIAGFVVTCIGDPGRFTYKRSRKGNSLPDRAVELVLKQTEKDFIIEDFFPTGSDERQYCSPGFNLPIGSLMRTRYGKYKEYHTSGDNRKFISFDALEKSVQKYLDVINLIDNNNYIINKMPFCEVQLGKRGLYPTLGSQKGKKEEVLAIMWILNLADGTNDLINIATRSEINYKTILKSVDKLLENGLIEIGINK